MRITAWNKSAIYPGAPFDAGVASAYMRLGPFLAGGLNGVAILLPAVPAQRQSEGSNDIITAVKQTAYMRSAAFSSSF